MIKLCLYGASGRMGSAVAALNDRRFEIIAGLDAEADDAVVAAALASCEVVVDFSSPAGFDALLAALAVTPRPLVSGTTGLGPEQQSRLRSLAAHAPVLWASNMSLGVAVLTRLLRQTAAQLDDWDIEIIETHHRHKVDAPSGTALSLAAAAQGARPGSSVVCGRAGDGRRHPGQIGIQALRGGTVVGHHEVHFFGDGQQLTLSHRAESRAQFARGALRAAYWLHDRSPGHYSLDQVLGL